MNYLFVTGMFRSGTTLMAKIMDAHPEISFASDPYRPFFNDYRDRIAETHGLFPGRPRQTPLGDYFFETESSRLMQAVQDSDLNQPISPERLQELIPVMAKRGAEFSIFVSERMGEVQGKTYGELYRSMMELVHRCYGKPGAKVVGSKEVWCTEFTGIMVRAFPQMKFIHVVRDPRAVFASRNIVGEKYPWFFLARQWRKLVGFTSIFSSDPATRKSVLVVRYEDLITDPENVCRKMCSFLGVNYSADMVDGTKYRDGDGSAWSQNSSHGTGKSISNAFAQKWRQVLTEAEIRFIETLCWPEMKLWGYEPVTFSGFPAITDEEILNPLIVPIAELAPWIRPFSTEDRLVHVDEMMKEAVRHRLLTHGQAPDDVIRAMFLNRAHFERLKTLARNPSHADTVQFSS